MTENAPVPDPVGRRRFGPGEVAPAIPHPTALLALLADDARLKVVAALALGSSSLAGVAEATALSVKVVGRAVARLVEGGLVSRERAVAGGAEDRILLHAERFLEVLQAQSRRTGPTPEELGATPEQAAVLRHLLVDGHLSSIPMQRSKRLLVLDFVATRFEPGRVYPERDVNFLIGKLHADYAAIRRYLVDEGFLERRDGFYWRSGGTFDIP